ncbi:MAG TPA: substrate-binding domain-containing protein [Clostridiaceae bacterium]|nr:substrate-binding domain-containing protein [Clostridiaceae bacterium]
MKNRIFYILLIVTMILNFSSCTSSKKIYNVDLIVKSTNSEFWNSVYDGAKAAGATYNINLRFLGPTMEKYYRNQVNIIKQSIQQKTDAIILAAGDYYMMAEPIKMAADAKIPVILVDSAVDSDQWISFISTDNYEAGRVLAQEIEKRVGGNAEIGVISFVKNASPSLERTTGFSEYINEYTDMKIVETVYCDSYIDKAEQLTRELLKNHPTIRVIAGLNAQSATGAARALANLQRSDIFLAGIDCTVEEAEYMELGILDVAVLQNPYLMGYFSVETAYKVLKGKKVERNIRTAVYVVDKDNMFSEEIQRLIFPFY